MKRYALAQKDMTKMDKPRYVLRPRFAAAVILLPMIWTALLVSIFGAFIIGGVICLVFSLLGMRWYALVWICPLAGYALSFAGLLLFAYINRKGTYRKSEYRFYDDHLEYIEGFWQIENKMIRYDKISEVSMRQGLIQKRYGLGSLVLAIPGGDVFACNNRICSGFLIDDVESPEQVFQAIKMLVNQCHEIKNTTEDMCEHAHSGDGEARPR